MADETLTQNPNKLLWTALNSGDFDLAKQALDAGADIESPSMSGATPFLQFAGEGKMDQARWLASQGANVNAVDRLRQTALHRLALANKHEGVEELVALGVDASLLSASGATALLLAVVQRKPVPMVEAFVNAGVDLNQAAKSGATPLLAAVGAGHLELALGMIQSGADPHKTDNMGQGILHSVQFPTDIRFIYALLQMVPNLDINKPSKSGTTPLAYFVERGQIDLIKLLITKGADVNSRSANNFNGRPTALMMLSNKSDVESVELALSRNADVSLRDNDGRNAVWYALNGSRKVQIPQGLSEEESQKAWNVANLNVSGDIIEQLVNAGLNPNDNISPDGLSPMLMAWGDGVDSNAWISRMAALGFPVNTSPEPGFEGDIMPSPLEMALNKEDKAAIDLLLSLGARPDMPSTSKKANGKTILHGMGAFFTPALARHAAQQMILSLGNKDDEASNATREKVKLQLKEVEEAKENDSIEVFLKLASYTENVDVLDGSGRTPFMTFLENGKMALAKKAMEVGANPWIRDHQGLNSIGVCLQAGNVPGLHALLDFARKKSSSDELNGLLIDAAYTSPEGGSQVRQPFIEAVYSLKDEPEMEKWLNEVDENGLTPLIISSATAQDDLIDLLLDLGANPNIQDAAGNTAIHHAISDNKSNIVKDIRAYGGAVDIPNKEGFTAVEIAVGSGKRYLLDAVQGDPEVRPEKWPVSESLEAAKKLGQEMWKDLRVVPVKSSKNRVKIAM